jgi:CMP-N,N'-diacetyllegionaminic acid synthase
MAKTGKLIALVAVRKGSQRVKNKNIRTFGNTNLLELKLEVLKKVKQIDEIVVNSDCDYMLSIAKNHMVSTHKREDYYASSECTNSEFHGHVAQVTDCDFILLAPVCSPFVTVKSHEESIKMFLNSECDSLTSVTEVKNHLWLNNKPLNYDLNNVPNSQDLPDVVKLNYGITLANKELMSNQKRVVGDNPLFYKLDELESVDVDTEFDFEMAELFYRKRILGEI